MARGRQRVEGVEFCVLLLFRCNCRENIHLGPEFGVFGSPTADIQKRKHFNAIPAHWKTKGRRSYERLLVAAGYIDHFGKEVMVKFTPDGYKAERLSRRRGNNRRSFKNSIDD